VLEGADDLFAIERSPMNAMATRRGLGLFCLVLALPWGAASVAQESSSYRMEQGTLNYGGDPRDGIVLASPGYRITLDAIGPWASGLSLSSASFFLSGGFIQTYAPPAEVQDLRFTGPTTMIWLPQVQAADYAVYKGTIGIPFDPGYGTCEQPPPALTSATATVTSIPGTGISYFYLVTARNALNEEGTKGFTSWGAERGNPIPCP
jgi:hypothetical protein